MAHYRKLPCADERGQGPIINCVAAGGVNLARAATNGTVPATDAEVLALRAATGDTQGGENLHDLQHGMQARYGFLTTLDESWPAIANGLGSGNRWVAAVGYLHQLPGRLWTQPTDVFHCVVFGPDSSTRAVIVDPLQRPVPLYRYISMAEVQTFCKSGGYSSLSIGEYTHAAYVGHIAKRGAFWQYTKHPSGRWTRRVAVSRGFSADTTLARAYVNVLGKTRRMVQVTTGYRIGQWVDTAQFVYTEILA
jgi:hypothetical protein